VSSTKRTSRFRLTDDVQFGTAFDRADACEKYMRDGPDKHGPGVGDMLVFMPNPQFFYWDTAGLSNYRYPQPVSEWLPPGQPEPGPPVFAFAWELRNFLGSGDERWLPPWMQGATAAQVRQLARLDPFIPLPPSRRPTDDPPDFLRPAPEAQDCQSLDPQNIARAVCVSGTTPLNRGESLLSG
jgi:hypothetical protein